MKIQTLVKKYLPQNQDIEVLVPNYKEPILPVNHGGSGWYGLMAYNEQGQLMCHECGDFRNSLSQHICKHGLNPKEYKKKYGLLNKTKLISNATLYKHRQKILNRPQFLREAKERFPQMTTANCRGTVKGKMALELRNRHDTCPAQLLRWLADLAEKFGPDITARQVEAIRPSLLHLLKAEFASFNKAKQLCQLITNHIGQHKPIYTQQLILEDMCRFYSKQDKWPDNTDYINGMMICSSSTVRRYGGLKALRQEAAMLRNKQEEARIRGEQVAQYANNIELEFAGTARR